MKHVAATVLFVVATTTTARATAVHQLQDVQVHSPAASPIVTGKIGKGGSNTPITHLRYVQDDLHPSSMSGSPHRKLKKKKAEEKSSKEKDAPEKKGDSKKKKKGKDDDEEEHEKDDDGSKRKKKKKSRGGSSSGEGTEDDPEMGSGQGTQKESWSESLFNKPTTKTNASAASSGSDKGWNIALAFSAIVFTAGLLFAAYALGCCSFMKRQTKQLKERAAIARKAKEVESESKDKKSKVPNLFKWKKSDAPDTVEATPAESSEPSAPSQ